MQFCQREDSLLECLSTRASKREKKAVYIWTTFHVIQVFSFAQKFAFLSISQSFCAIKITRTPIKTSFHISSGFFVFTLYILFCTHFVHSDLSLVFHNQIFWIEAVNNTKIHIHFQRKIHGTHTFTPTTEQTQKQNTNSTRKYVCRFFFRLPSSESFSVFPALI